MKELIIPDQPVNGASLFGNKKADVQTQINALAAFKQNHTDVKSGVTEPPSYMLPPELMQHHAMLFFQCDNKIAAKIEDMKTEDGTPLLVRGTLGENKAKSVSLWNGKTQSYDCYEEILAVRDRKSGFQGAAFYDHERERMTFNFGGADFGNTYDMLVSGIQMMFGQVDNRMAKAIPFTEQAMETLKERHPDLMQELTVDIAGHSVGPNAMPLAVYCLDAKYGIKPRTQTLIDPIGAQNAYTTVSEMIAKAEGLHPYNVYNDMTANNVHTHKVMDGTCIDYLPLSLKENVGDVIKHNIQGGNAITRHMGAAWIGKFLENSVCTETVSLDAAATSASSFTVKKNI